MVCRVPLSMVHRPMVSLLGGSPLWPEVVRFWFRMNLDMEFGSKSERELLSQPSSSWKNVVAEVGEWAGDERLHNI